MVGLRIQPSLGTNSRLLWSMVSRWLSRVEQLMEMVQVLPEPELVPEPLDTTVPSEATTVPSDLVVVPSALVTLPSALVTPVPLFPATR